MLKSWTKTKLTFICPCRSVYRVVKLKQKYVTISNFYLQRGIAGNCEAVYNVKVSEPVGTIVDKQLQRKFNDNSLNVKDVDPMFIWLKLKILCSEQTLDE